MQRDERPSSELATLTVSMLLSLGYLMAVCWVIPVAPLMIAWMLDWTFTAFLTIWFGGLPLTSLILYSCSKMRGR